MAFDIKHMEGTGGQSKRGSTPQAFNYRTADALATVITTDYFADIKEKLEVGDTIDVEVVTFAADGFTPTETRANVRMYVAVKTSTLFELLALSSKDSVVLTDVLTDISTASNTTVAAAVGGDIVNIKTVLGGAITVGDAAITFDIGGTVIQNSAITVANAASAVGDVDQSKPSGLRTLAPTDALKMLSDGGSTGVQELYVMYEVIPSAGKTEIVEVTIPDISTASSTWAIAPVAGTITKIGTIITNAITVGDATITAEINTVAVTGSSITIANAGSAAGTKDYSFPTATNAVEVGDAIEIITDGGSTDVCITGVSIEITTSGIY